MKTGLELHNFKNVSLILFLASILFLAFSMYNRVETYPAQDMFGLAQELNIFYWLGLSSILASLLFLTFNDKLKDKKYEILFLLEACLFAIFLYAIATLAEENVFFPDSWGHAVGVISVLVYGASNQPSSYAAQFPGAFILQSILYLITNIDLVSLTKYFPVLFSVLVVPTSYVLLRKFFSNTKKLWLATIFLVAGSAWVFPKIFNPNSFGLIFYLLIFFFVFSQDNKKTMGISFLLGFAAIFTHPTTLPFLILSLLSVLVAMKLFRRHEEGNERDILISNRSFSFFFIFFLSISWLVWLNFSAHSVLATLISEIQNFSLSNPAARFTGISSELEISQTLKIGYSLLFLLGGVLGVFNLFWKWLRTKKIGTIYPFLAAGWIGACIVLGIFSGFFQGGEFFERTLLYGFVPLTILSFMIYESKYGKAILLLIILIGAPLSVFAAYTNETFQYSPMTETYGAVFLANHTSTSQKTSFTAFAPSNSLVQFYILQWYYEHKVVPDSLSDFSPKVFVWTETSERFYSVYFFGRPYAVAQGAPPVEFNSVSGQLDLVYDNEEFQVLVNASSIQNVSGNGG
jgi:hypothetical protein